MVSRDVPSVKPGSTGDLEALDTVRTLVESMSEEATLDGQRSAKQAVFQAMLEVPWLAGEGIPDSPTDGTQYAELLAAGCGSIEEVISRDVPRTFPEHPLFNTAEGQQQLLRVLKAYAAADPEVGYCQGMAFAAGVLLMYMPEEPAFRLFQRLMSPEGPNLRRYYLPGLEHLKIELSCFELLLSSHQPLLHQHLLGAGLPALLYAAQWLMTTYACPFPVHVAARVLDVLLQSNSDAILLRMGLAVMEALSSKLLELQDFEEVITYLKVKPLSWPVHMHRKVFAAALSSAVTDAELSAAAAAAREEFARSGRAASFSSKHLARQATAGGTMRHELVPGPMGPRTLSATEAAAAMAVAAVDSGRGVQGGEGAAAAAGGSGEQAGEAAEAAGGSSSAAQQQLSGRLSSTHDTGVLVGPLASGSGIAVDDMDSLEDLITDLDLLLPGGASDTDSLGSMGSPGPCEPERKPEQL